jgi:hypothetical protein
MQRLERAGKQCRSRFCKLALVYGMDQEFELTPKDWLTGLYVCVVAQADWDPHQKTG